MKNKIYFTVRFHSVSGFTDQLVHMKAGRKLGLSLGYTYLHSPLCTTRIERIKMPLSLPWFFAKLINRIYRRFTRKHPTRYDDWLGWTRHFTRQAETERCPSQAECKKVCVNLDNASLEKYQVVTFEDLQRLIKDIVSREKPQEQSLLLILRIDFPVYSFLSLMRSMPDSDDGLNFRSIYMEQRHRRPCKSQYPRKGRVKTLMHVRLGDIAVVRTPWKTHICYKKRGVWEKAKETGIGWFECRDERDFSCLTVTDFYHFIQGLSSRFDDNALALSIFSDGFERAFHEIYRLNNHPVFGLGLPRKWMNALLRHRGYCACELKILNKIKNSVSNIGETPGKFFKFIDAVMTANLLITAFPMQWTALRMTQNLFLSAEIPPAVLLYKPVAEEQVRRFLEDNSSAKIIPVDVSAPDFDGVAARLVECLPQLAPFLRSRSVRS